MNHQLRFYSYKIPLAKPFKSAKAFFHHREGFILGNDDDIWTEIAPLPGFSPDNLEKARTFLKSNRNKIESHFLERNIDVFLNQPEIRAALASMPSVRFGLSMLAEQQKALSAQRPLYKWWIDQNKFKISADTESRIEKGSTISKTIPVNNHYLIPSNPDTIECNALIGSGTLSNLHNQIKAHHNKGFRWIKIKLPKSVTDAIAIITELTSHYPEIQFRFDANGIYPPDQASVLMQSLQEKKSSENLLQNLDYIEEPVTSPTPSSLTAIASSTIPFALDESIKDLATIQSLRKHRLTFFIVLKPTLFGSFSEISEIYALKLPVVLSSAFESYVGQTILTHLAAFFNDGYKIAHGLATGNFFKPPLRDTKEINPDSGALDSLSPQSMHDALLPFYASSVTLPKIPGTGLTSRISSSQYLKSF